MAPACMYKACTILREMMSIPALPLPVDVQDMDRMLRAVRSMRLLRVSVEKKKSPK